MIAIDFSQLGINAITANLEEKDLSGKNRDLGLIRHVVLNSIVSVRTKFKQRFGSELVFAIDNKTKPYWRKTLNPYYKGTRKENREKSKIDWEFVFDGLSTLKRELIEHFPYKVIESPGAEADDVIATLAKYVHNNRRSQEGVVEVVEPFLIVSGDGDFAQLHKFENVEQYSPREGKLITLKSKREIYEALMTKIVKGDPGDAITNILSPIDSFHTKTRQKAVSTEKFLRPLLESTDRDWLTEEQTSRFDLNRRLIDFDYIPEEIQKDIVETYLNYNPSGNKTKVFNYLIQHKLNILFGKVDEF